MDVSARQFIPDLPKKKDADSALPAKRKSPLRGSPTACKQPTAGGTAPSPNQHPVNVFVPIKLVSTRGCGEIRSKAGYAEHALTSTTKMVSVGDFAANQRKR